MNKEIWEKTKGQCKENILSRKRIIKSKSIQQLTNNKGLYLHMNNNQYQQVLPQINNDKYGSITGISQTKDNNYMIHIGADVSNKGTFYNKDLNDKPINEKDYICNSPILWDEYKGKCIGADLLEINNNEIAEIKRLPFKALSNYNDYKCRQTCLKNDKCDGYEVNKNNCKLYKGTIVSGDNIDKIHCKVKPNIYKFKDYNHIDKSYKKSINDKNKVLDKIINDTTLENNNLKEKQLSDTVTLDKLRFNTIKNREKHLEKEMDLKTNYFNTLANFHKNETTNRILNRNTVSTGNNIYYKNKNIVNNNKNILKELDIKLDTYNRQGNIIFQSLLKRNNIETFLKLLVLYFFIIMILLILKHYNMIKNKDTITYIIFILTVLLTGLVFLRFVNSKNRSKYNYQNKNFKVKIEPKKK